MVMLPTHLLGLALTRWRLVQFGAVRGGLGRRLAFRDEPPSLGVSRLVLSLLPLHLAELRGVVAVLRTRVGISTASLGLLSLLVSLSIFVFSWLVTHGLETPAIWASRPSAVGGRSLPTSITLLAFRRVRSQKRHSRRGSEEGMRAECETPAEA